MSGVVSPFNLQVEKSFQSTATPGTTGRSAKIGAIRDRYNKTTNTQNSNGQSTKRSVGGNFKRKLASIKGEIDDLYEQSCIELEDLKFASVDIEDTTEADTAR